MEGRSGIPEGMSVSPLFCFDDFSAHAISLVGTFDLPAGASSRSSASVIRKMCPVAIDRKHDPPTIFSFDLTFDRCVFELIWPFQDGAMIAELFVKLRIRDATCYSIGKFPVTPLTKSGIRRFRFETINQGVSSD